MHLVMKVVTFCVFVFGCLVRYQVLGWALSVPLKLYYLQLLIVKFCFWIVHFCLCSFHAPCNLIPVLLVKCKNDFWSNSL